MRIAILSESDADEAAIRVLLEALLGESVEPIPRRVRSRGIRAALDQIGPVLKQLHYQQTAEALVVVVDTDNSPLHSAQHEGTGNARGDCRLCQLRAMVDSVRSSLKTIPGRPQVRVGLGVAPPSIEAWLLAGSDSQISEAGWTHKQQRRVTAPDEIRKLKERLSGGKTRSARAMLDATVAAAEQTAKNIAQLEQLFPNSFGPLAREVRAWTSKGSASAGE
jgi:hypothetical protein